MKSDVFLNTISERRSIYSISKEKVLSQKEVGSIVGHALKYSPSSYNTQPTRAMLLWESESDKLWSLALDALLANSPTEKHETLKGMIQSFSGGHATVLFFIDSAVVTASQKQYPSVATLFPEFALQSCGMTQFIVWTALAQEGLGASLQHFNALLQDKVITTWKLPPSWHLISQMPLGKLTKPAASKTFLPLDERLFFFPTVQ